MAFLLRVSCLLTYFYVVHSKPSFIENDSIVFPEGDNDTGPKNITDKLKECIRDSFKIEFKNECRPLLITEGACPDGQWLVLDLLSASLPKPIITGKCVLKRCDPKQHYWAEQKRCVYANESSTLCRQGNVVNTDYFGEGYCRCIKDPVHIRDRHGICYPAYTKGPCSNGQVWIEVNGQSQCRTDNCTTTRSRFPEKIIVPWSNGKCYAINERGPCVQGNVIRINMWSVQPECGDTLTTLNLVDPPCTGFDHSGKCTNPVKTSQDYFFAQVLDQARKKRTRKEFKDPK